MNQRDDKFLFGFVFLVCPALYLLLRALPDLIFHVLPCVGAAFIIGQLWTWGCHVGGVNYRRATAFMGATLLIHFLAFNYPPVSKGFFDNLSLYHAYNDLKSSIEGLINASPLALFRPFLSGLLPPRVYKPALYDWRDLSWSLWLGICVGAPGYFLYRANQEDQERMRGLMARTEAAEQTARRTESEARSESWRYRNIISDQERTIAALNAKVPPEAIDPESGEPVPPPDDEVFETDLF